MTYIYKNTVSVCCSQEVFVDGKHISQKGDLRGLRSRIVAFIKLKGLQVCTVISSPQSGKLSVYGDNLIVWLLSLRAEMSLKAQHRIISKVTKDLGITLNGLKGINEPD